MFLCIDCVIVIDICLTADWVASNSGFGLGLGLILSLVVVFVLGACLESSASVPRQGNYVNANMH